MSFKKRYNSAIELYLLGDKVGSRFETGSDLYDPRSIDEIIKKTSTGVSNTDEGDLVINFIKFLSIYPVDDIDDFLLKWADYIETNRKPTTYGKTYKGFFATVKLLKRSDNFNINKILKSSANRNSFGNGCIPLVLPMYHHLNTIGFKSDQIYKHIIKLTNLTHTHKNAIGGVTILFCIIDMIYQHNILKSEPLFLSKNYHPWIGYLNNIDNLEDVFFKFLDENIKLPPDEFVTYVSSVTTIGAVFYALYSLNVSNNISRLIQKVISMNGDVDSVLSLAMMIYGLANYPQVSQELFPGFLLKHYYKGNRHTF